MNRTLTTKSNLTRLAVALLIGAAWSGVMLPLASCDKTESSTKSTTTKTTETPEGIKKTTETTEKKVETSPK